LVPCATGFKQNFPASHALKMNTASEAAADVRVSFEVPKDFKVPLRVDVDSPNPPYQAMREVGKQKFRSRSFVSTAGFSFASH
jgi:hypothetical protein